MGVELKVGHWGLEVDGVVLELQIRHGHWALQRWRSCGCSEWQGRWLVGDAEAPRLLPFDETVEEEANQDGQGGGARKSQVQRVYSFLTEELGMRE